MLYHVPVAQAGHEPGGTVIECNELEPVRLIRMGSKGDATVRL
jgi:hypothetical protein